VLVFYRTKKQPPAEVETPVPTEIPVNDMTKKEGFGVRHFEKSNRKAPLDFKMCDK
jgi:hypothetical protein